VGLENIDVADCRRRGVEVVYTPDANTLAVGDFVFGYLLQLLRPWEFFRDAVYPPKEFKRIRDTVRGRQLNELTLGILGDGTSGAAGRAHRRQRVWDAGDLQRPGADCRAGFRRDGGDKPTLYRECDILTIHVDMRPGNEYLVGARELAMLKSSAVVINTSRGEVLDARALAEAIREKRIFAAALDVFSPEPPAADFPLLGFSNVLLTPHLAARTHTALENMSWVVRDVVAVLKGEAPKYPAPF
jgi:phosphoglycerate dehydrogenase-like enzyme